jgi:NTP pyrophosphatase (non-canonical NTP hydrolase)
VPSKKPQHRPGSNPVSGYNKCLVDSNIKTISITGIDVQISELTQEMDKFVASKGWYDADSQRPQTPRNIAISLCLEAAEVLEHFQWADSSPNYQELASELADVTLYLMQLAHVSNIDLEKAVLEKLEINYQRNWESKGS